MLLYKYRSLKDFKNIADILTEKRLYASSFLDLNDPMEGHFYYYVNSLPNDFLEKLWCQKKESKICSLGSEKDCFLLWTYYADGHKGIAIEIEVDEQELDRKSTRLNSSH